MLGTTMDHVELEVIVELDGTNHLQECAYVGLYTKRY